MKTRRYRIALLLAWMLPMVLTASSYAQEQCLQDAWDGFNRKGYESAIQAADQCIDDFGKAAARIQAKLEADSIPPPPTGAVSDAEKNKIFKRGLLNDVATAYFVKGRSAEYLYRQGGSNSAAYKEKAEQAFVATCQYKYGRTWDPRGWFWSPCEAATDRLRID